MHHSHYCTAAPLGHSSVLSDDSDQTCEPHRFIRLEQHSTPSAAASSPSYPLHNISVGLVVPTTNRPPTSYGSNVFSRKHTTFCESATLLLSCVMLLLLLITFNAPSHPSLLHVKDVKNVCSLIQALNTPICSWRLILAWSAVVVKSTPVGR